MHAPARTKPDPLLLTCAALPALALTVFYGYVLRARLSLSSWPEPYHPDPKDLGFGLHHGLVTSLLELAIASPVALVVCLLLRRAAGLRDRRMLGPVALFAAGYALVWGMLVVDPGRFFEWFAD